MACNRFGQLFAVTTFGESHGKGIGAVVDGCPAGLEVDLEMIQKELDRRKPGGIGVSPRREEDRVSILSGVFEGRTTGAPIALWIENRDVDSSKYDRVHKPGHASRTYLQKYGVFDYLGGGRSSGRETAARVAAGAIAKRLIAPMEVRTTVRAEQAEEGDSIGGIVEGEIVNVVAGLGDPVYQKNGGDASVCDALHSCITGL